MTHLILVGLVHREFNGSEGLEKMLEVLRPEILSIEFSTESLKILKNNQAEMARIIQEIKDRRVSEKLVNFYVDMMSRDDYEHTVPKNYSQNHKIPLYLSDDPRRVEPLRESSIKVIGELRDVLNKIPPDKQMSLPVGKDSKQQNKKYEFARAVLEGHNSSDEIDNLLAPVRSTLIGQRDEYMENRIRDILRNHLGSRVVHIGGFVHLFDDPKKQTLYSRLKDLQPKRYLLHAPYQPI